jgi:hypothetical protein
MARFTPSVRSRQRSEPSRGYWRTLAITPAESKLLILVRRQPVVLVRIPGASGDLFVFTIVFGPVDPDLCVANKGKVEDGGTKKAK